METRKVPIVFCYKQCPITVISCIVLCDNITHEIPSHTASELEAYDEYSLFIIEPEKQIGFDIQFYSDIRYRAIFKVNLNDLCIMPIEKIKVCLIPDGMVFLLLESHYKSYLIKDIKYDKASTIIEERLSPDVRYRDWCKQYTYRYRFYPVTNDLINEDESATEVDLLSESLSDGTINKLNDGGLFKYHEAGKPKKLALKWHINKREYAAYLWFRDEEIKAVFDRFYGPHPETKTDFIINIDAEKNKYQLSMNRYGLKEPYVITEDAYEMIVFRNKFECFRSGNYSQATGAWIW